MNYDVINKIHLLNTTNGAHGVVISVIDAMLGLVGVIAILFIIIGGFRYIIASGNPDQIQNAKNSILYGVIGLIVAILAYAIVTFVIGQLT